jgi:hypothetical protein
VLSWCFESKSVAVFCVPGSIIAHFSVEVTGDVFELCGLEQENKKIKLNGNNRKANAFLFIQANPLQKQF